MIGRLGVSKLPYTIEGLMISDKSISKSISKPIQHSIHPLSVAMNWPTGHLPLAVWGANSSKAVIPTALKIVKPADFFAKTWQSLKSGPAGLPRFIEHSMLQPETLDQLAREFILREYANDGWVDHDLDLAVAKAIKRIERGEYLITFDPETESVGIIDRKDPALRTP